MVVGPDGAQTENNSAGEGQQQTTVLLCINRGPMYICTYQIANLITAISALIDLNRQNKDRSIM
jgi:hypothetical protein